jgi:hypothetical protein
MEENKCMDKKKINEKIHNTIHTIWFEWRRKNWTRST